MRSLSDEFESRTDEYKLQQARFEALRDALGNYGNYRYVNFYDLLNPNNQNWQDYTYKTPDGLSQGHVARGTPVGEFINNIRNTKNIGEIYKQSELWNSYDPLSSRDNGINYIRHFIPKFGMHSTTPSVGSRPVQTTAGGTGGGAQGVVAVGGAQGAQAGVQAGAEVARGGVQGSNNGSSSAQGTQGVQAGGTGGTLASPGVPRGGTKTIGYEYDPNPNNVSLAYVMRNAPEQERRDALINEWNQEHGISYATGKDGLIYRTDPQHPNGYVDPFKNDLSKIGSTGYATGKGMLTSGSNGSYSSQEGMQSPMPVSDNGKFRVAWKDPMAIIGHFGRGAFTDNEYNQLVNHAVNDLGFNKDIFSGR